ncbi:DNA-binding domain-containing protein [Paracoccaceae bacterium Fryx2]|nr:DNA-binding domain-containing protein [Paracoccaceae bacterium Fryx2]
MNVLTVGSIVGLPDVPATNRGVRDWLKRLCIPTKQSGQRFTFAFTDLPAPVRLAYIQRECARAGISAGTYDDVAHERFADAPPKMRAAAEQKAAVARLLIAAGKMLSWPEKVSLVASELGEKGASEASLRRVLSDIEGVDPINFAPALLADYRGGRKPTEIPAEAWSYFLTALRDGGEEYPLRKAWCDARDLKLAEGWDWPSWSTVFRRWDALSEVEKLTIRVGREEAARRLAQPAVRDKTSILPLEWVSLDGRTQDFWAVGEDGKVRRHTFLALVDCASNAVLDWEVADAENARSTVRLIRCCATTILAGADNHLGRWG